MLPLSDTRGTKRFAFITLLIIVINVIVFLFELGAPDTEEFMLNWALVPANVNFASVESLSRFITNQFLHAGFVHIISNMWFLWIFGDNVEEKFGSILFLLIYLLSGVIGGFSQYIFAPSSEIPMLGASGAVAGILGAYYVFFPHHRIRTLVPVFGFVRIVSIPASIMLVYWFLTQVFSGVGSIGYAAMGGVAWFAHVGGFVTGYVVAKIFDSVHIVEYIEDESLL
ncbi:rhomboid family intramembrane serine protease [Candidatus Woesebacteria bacterium]|nr:rhomboid family intramembrane serine protease [Candidatus Woesebacteria bacterium]